MKKVNPGRTVVKKRGERYFWCKRHGNDALLERARPNEPGSHVANRDHKM